MFISFVIYYFPECLDDDSHCRDLTKPVCTSESCGIVKLVNFLSLSHVAFLVIFDDN